LKWAIENGCPWPQDAGVSLLEGGHVRLMKWAKENGCPGL